MFSLFFLNGMSLVTMGARKSQLILLAKPTPRLSQAVSSFESAQFNLRVVEETNHALELAESSEAEILVHILEDFQRMDVGFFHHRLIRRPTRKIRHTFIVYRGQNLRAVAFAVDCGMRKALQSELSYETLGDAVELAMNAYLTLGVDAQRAMHVVTSGDHEFTEEEASLVESVASAYEGLHSVQLAFAHTCIGRGDIKTATEIARDVLSQDPRNVRAMTVLGEALAACGQTADALRVHYAAEGLSAGNPKRLALLGILLSQTGDRENALKCLFGSAQIYPVTQTLRTLAEHLQLTNDERNQFFETVNSTGCSSEELETLRQFV